MDHPSPSHVRFDYHDSSLDHQDTDALLSGPGHQPSPNDLENGRIDEPAERPVHVRLLEFLRCRREGAISLSLLEPVEKHSLGRRISWSRSRRCWSLLIALMLGLSALTAFLVYFGSPTRVDIEDPLTKGYRLGLYGEDVLEDPSRVTLGVQPLPLHSHNDYWRRVALYEALHFGCTGVEADVWHFKDDDVLYVGHDTRSLTPQRTFASLYVDPLLDILDRRNEKTITDSWYGVFHEEPNRTLVLLVDFKTDGPTLWRYVMDQLEPLRSRGFLTYVDGAQTIVRPITVVGTGYAPFDIISTQSENRDIFFDAPITKLNSNLLATLPQGDFLSMVSWAWANLVALGGGEGTSVPGGVTTKTFTRQNSFYTSTSFSRAFGLPWFGQMSDAQVEMLREQIASAHLRGLKARFWSTPNWPKSWAKRIRQTLAEEGADYINVDDLEAASKIDWAELRAH